ncbi:MAG: hypothetical protein HUJ72_08415 [Blautia sp.]|nr:hypothetical protein [Blautia sp.]
MKQRFNNISMNGRMAYVIMCVEAWLQGTYPDRDWTIVSEAMWRATEMNWGDWPEIYAGYIPHVLFSYEEYGEDLTESFPEDIYNRLKKLYLGITSGNEDDPEDMLDYMLTKPHEMATVYEGTGIGDGNESIEIIEGIEKVLNSSGIPLPDHHRLYFSDHDQLHGWGNSFDGRFLSVILGK